MVTDQNSQDRDEDEPGSVYDDLIEQITEEGNEVFSLEWDSGGPGAGAGCEYVYRWRGKFAATSLDDCNPGPFNSLDEALAANDLFTVTSATTSIRCSLLTAKALAKRLQCQDDGHAIEINGELWVYHNEGGFTKKRHK